MATPGSARFNPIETKEQKAKRLRKAAAARRRKRAADAEAKKLAERAEQERKIKAAQDLARWQTCLQCLADSVPRLKSNPWLIILEPNFIHDYLDSLTETLANLSKHEEDLERVRIVLQEVYQAFVDVGHFAQHQPAFYISNPHTIKRFVRLLEQVAHRGSDKALFPNVLSLLGPTFDRPALYELLADARIVNSLMSFVRTDWMPTPSTLKLLLNIFEKLSVSQTLQHKFMLDPGYPKLQGLARGTIDGFTDEQQERAMQALALFPEPKLNDEDDDDLGAGDGL